jgi:hypothetical protein
MAVLTSAETYLATAYEMQECEELQDNPWLWSLSVSCTLWQFMEDVNAAHL